MSRYASLLVLFVIAGTAQAQAKTEPLAVKVKSSITNGVANLVNKQQSDGSWESSNSDYKGGSSALIVLALLNCDGVLDDFNLEQKRKQSIENGLKYLRGIDSTKVYVRSLQTMALAEARKSADRPLIERNVNWLLDARIYKNNQFAGWGYGPPAGTSPTDASNSQYAMLALWYARQADVKIERPVWKEIQTYYVRTQQKDGSWRYSGDWGEDKGRPSVTMTVAGLCGLLIAGMELNENREQWGPRGKIDNCGVYGENQPVADAMRWLTSHFTVDRGGDTYYHLYGLERAGRLSGLRFFGDHDWYREGCEYLTNAQNAPSGSWPGLTWNKTFPDANSSFALLFLSKGRTPVLISKLVHGKWKPPEGRNEKDNDWNNDRNDLRHLTEYIARHNNPFEHKVPLAWQTYDISQALQARQSTKAVANQADEADVVADMLQSPILYITGHQNPKIRIADQETNLIKRYIENGGFIFAEACCGSPNFDEGIKEWVKANWEDADFDYVLADHPIWTCFNTVRPDENLKLMALRIGCRTVMLYSPQDLSCAWESNRWKEGPTKRAFELGTNIVAYATGKMPPSPRLTPIQLVDEKSMVAPLRRGSFQVTQIQYPTNNWPPAPKAMINLVKHVHKLTGLDATTEMAKLTLRDPSEATGLHEHKFFYLHGRQEIKPPHPTVLPVLRFTLENGGLLFADACCGDEKFDQSFREFAKNLFPNEKLERVPVEPIPDGLFGAKLNNGTVLSAANIKCRIKPSTPVIAMDPFLEGIRVNGRWVILYSKYDIGCALEGKPRRTASATIGKVR